MFVGICSRKGPNSLVKLYITIEIKAVGKIVKILINPRNISDRLYVTHVRKLFYEMLIPNRIEKLAFFSSYLLLTDILYNCLRWVVIKKLKYRNVRI